MQETFYMVKGDGPTNVRHASREIAEREAKRLARENPGTPFFVMMAIDGFVKDDVRHIDLHFSEPESRSDLNPTSPGGTEMPIMAKHMDRRKMQRDLYAAYKAGSLNAPENPMNGIESIAAERARQIEIEGWTPEHDDAHEDGAMALAASLYAFQAHTDAAHCHGVALARRDMCPTQWPWAADWWKPKDRRRDLVRAGALIAAEIDRLDRAAVRDVNQSN